MDEFIYVTVGEGPALGSPSPQKRDITYQTKGGYYEITMNYPHTLAFTRMLSSAQRRKYTLLFRNTIAALGIDNIVESNYIFEYLKSGHHHLHGYVIIKDELPIYPIGGISDMVKTYLLQMPKKYARYRDSCMYSEMGRYRCPSICIQYQYKENTARLQEWREYLCKTR